LIKERALVEEHFLLTDAAPVFASKILRIDTSVEAAEHMLDFHGNEIHGPWSMLWVWRNHPELWYFFL
jgi:hypothetical protein